MNVNRSSFSDLLGKKGRSRQLGVVLFICVLLMISKALEFVIVRYQEDNWERIVEAKCAEYIKEAENAFMGVQRVTRRIATEVAQHPIVLEYLATPAMDQGEVFEHVAKVSREQNVGIEVYDNHGAMVAWEGQSGPAHQREVLIALAGQLTSYVTRTPISSQLFVCAPVRTDGRIVGAVLVRRTIDVNFPLNNKFIKREGLADKLSQDIGANVELNFAENAEPRKDGRFVSATMFGIDSSKVGVVSILRPAKSASIDSMTSLFERFNALVLVSLVAILVIVVGRRVFAIQSILLRSVAVTAVIWLARYGLLWLDVPSMFFSMGIFDPSNYASQFGGGLAKSIAELTLTALALLFNVTIIAKIVIIDLAGRSPWWHPRSRAIRSVLALAIPTLMFLLLRGYAATIRSAVFDSTLSYNDPRVIVPSSEFSLMVLNLFLISFCLIVVVVGLTSFTVRLFSKSDRAHGNVPWVICSGLLVIAAILFGVLQENSLITTAYRLWFAAGIVAFTYYLHRRARHMLSLARAGTLLIALGLSAVFFYPLLDQMVHEKDRSRVEVFAGEVLRPTDSWLTFVVDEALQSFSTDETIDVLLSGNTEDIRRLAFTRWAESSICREGYVCVFAVFDSSAHELSHFMLGGQSMLVSELNASRARLRGKGIHVTEVGSGINAMKVYTGTMPILFGEQNAIAHAVVIITAGQQTLFRGETPTILRSVSKESIESFYRPIALSEFHDGILVASNNAALPIGYKLPENVQRRFTVSSRTSFWNEEEFDGKRFETLYVRRSAESSHVVALSMQELDTLWHLVWMVKVLVYYAIVVLVVLIGFFLMKWIGRRRYEFAFRDRLLVALLVTAIVPMMIIGSLGRMLARERLLENATKRLEQETNTVASNIKPRVDTTLQRGPLSLSPLAAEQIASDIGTDFNVYVGSDLQLSSRPELYDAGILDRRMSGNAYASVMIRKKRFFLQTETLGLYQYTVGYRPFVAANGSITGVVSVPTLYRQDMLDEEVARQNALIFGVYAVVLFAAVIIATTFANRIAAPIHRLTEATKKVSRGDLDVSVRITSTDGEIGALIRAFETMTKDLKRSREELITFERELAWKEMAQQVAHEIKNPLTPMKLALQHLRQTYKDKIPDLDRVFDEVSRTIIEQIDALSRIASEFSHFARMPKPRLEPCDVNDVLDECMRLFDQELGVRFEVTKDRKAPPILADREELRRAFINIIRNSIQAMENGGPIVITTTKSEAAVVVTIRDFGVGIPDELKEKLFQPNFSTKTDGMGLGLAIVKKTIDDLNGSISIESQEGEGTTVKISFPAKDEASDKHYA
jgi:signal transduction histidine kinase